MKKYKLYCNEVLRKTIDNSKDKNLKLDFIITITSGTLFISNSLINYIYDFNNNKFSNVIGSVLTCLLAASGFKTYIDLDKKIKL